jgi:predicted nucleic acid-binding protein
LSHLLDTNVVSEGTRPRPDPGVARWLRGVDEDRLFISVVSIAEIRRGVALLPPGRRRDSLAVWLSRELPERFTGRVLDIDFAITERWGDLMAKSQGVGAALEPMDAFFAATALARDLILATRNVRDFQAFGVRLFNPWTAGDAA